ncbi:lactonase family protein [Pirellulales bacterium]|nr:lactonase family protein [Pirellulales bacterium]
MQSTSFASNRLSYSMCLLGVAAVSLCSSLYAEEPKVPFAVYAVDGPGKQVLHVQVHFTNDHARVVHKDGIPLPGRPRGIAKHPKQSSLIVTLLPEESGNSRAVTLQNDNDGMVSIVGVSDLQDSTGYTSFDRTGRYFLTSSYQDGHFDVYQVSPDGLVGDRVSHQEVSEKYAHSVLTTPDNRFLYVPCVKELNAIYQYAFDEQTGQVLPLEPFDAKPPYMFGPRHIAYHPDLPFVYFSNEQQLGVSAYRIEKDGQLAALQHATTLPRRSPYTAGVRDMHASDIAVTGDGKFLFLALRDFVGDEDSVFTFAIAVDGRLSLVSRKRVGDIPWCLRVSPSDSHLLVSESRDKTLAVFPIHPDGSLGDAVRMDWGTEVRNMVVHPLSAK